MMSISIWLPLGTLSERVGQCVKVDVLQVGGFDGYNVTVAPHVFGGVFLLAKWGR